MNSIFKTCIVLTTLLPTLALFGGCKSQEKGRSGLATPLNDAKVNVHTRAGADWPVTRYWDNKGQECDIAIPGAICHNADKSNVEFAWRENGIRSPIFKVKSGGILVQGLFPPINSSGNSNTNVRFPIPWPIIFTNWVSIGTEGTTFAVYVGNDFGGKPCNYIFLFDGGPLKIEILGASPPLAGILFPPGDAKHQLISYEASKVMYVEVTEPTAGNIVISPPKDVLAEPGLTSAKAAYQCLAELRRVSKLDTPYPALSPP